MGEMRALTCELVHLSSEQYLRLYLLVFDGVVVKVLENDAAARHLPFPGRLGGRRGRFLWRVRRSCRCWLRFYLWRL